jgi:hypothetical protein
VSATATTATTSITSVTSTVTAATATASVLHRSFDEKFYFFKAKTDIVFTFNKVFFLN